MITGLKEYAFSNFALTDDQKKAIESIDTFLQEDKSCFLLKGYAGTGKTFLTKCIVKFLREENTNCILMAPTGRAARILQEKTGCDATTIHKGIYNLKELDEIQTSKEGKEKFKFRYGLNHIETNTCNVYVVDEASMISDTYAEDDFFVFGSGRLLKDLLDFLALNNRGRRDKLIFIGDNAQLPPVTDKLSGALSVSYLLEKYSITAGEYELTQVVRQGIESGILANSIYIRDLLKDNKRNGFQLNTTYDDTRPIKPEEVVETFLQKNQELDTTKAVVINYSNSAALDYNLRIREKLFGNVKGIQVGDILMINQNNYNYEPELLNGMFVKVKEVSPVPEIKGGMKSYDEKGEDCEVSHVFRRVTIEVPVFDRYVDVDCMILDSFLYSDKPTLDYAENIALYIDFKIRYPHLKPKTKEFADALRKDPYFNALRVKYGYAITCHKAQGGEWDTAIINLDVSQSKLSEMFLRWTYTAITRARKELYLFNIPQANQFTTLSYNHRLLATEGVAVANTLQTIQYTLPEDFETKVSRFQLQNAPGFLKDKFIELLARFHGSAIEITRRVPHNFQETYVLSKEGKTAGITFWYNGNGRFTTRSKAVPHTTSEDLFTEVKQIVEKPFSFHLITTAEPDRNVETATTITIEFSAEHKPLEVLYLELNRLLEPYGATVVEIRHNHYLEQYRIRRQDEHAHINFYYDGRHRFTTAEPNLPNCNSNRLLEDIATAVDLLKKS